MTEQTRFAVCINNSGYAASLELRKLYEVIADPDAGKDQMIRIVDESGEDYLFPEENFVPIELPAEVKKPFERAARKQRRAARAPETSGAVKRLPARAAKQTKTRVRRRA